MIYDELSIPPKGSTDSNPVIARKAFESSSRIPKRLIVQGIMVPTHRIELWTPSLRNPEIGTDMQENQLDTSTPRTTDTGQK